jgi:4-hydroxybenzoate polyprenyltransferase
MSQLKIFIELTRLNKPIGIMLLFWPCSWSLAYSYSINNDLNLFLYYLLLFFLGSVLMRSAGCIVNDIVDKDFDKKVKRTKKRPLAARRISTKLAAIYVIFLCIIAFFILIQFNKLTIFLGMASMVPAFLYPFMKRITWWPQLFLGLTFNWGIIMAGSAVNNSISTEIIFLYVSAIFWTIGYDTIYGVQDIKDDEIIGLKSTSIKFKKNIKKFVAVNYLISSSFLIYLLKDSFDQDLFVIFLMVYLISLILQIKIFEKNKPEKCLRAFKLNYLSGFILFMAITSIK